MSCTKYDENIYIWGWPEPITRIPYVVGSADSLGMGKLSPLLSFFSLFFSWRESFNLVEQSKYF